MRQKIEISCWLFVFLANFLPRTYENEVKLSMGSGVPESIGIPTKVGLKFVFLATFLPAIGFAKGEGRREWRSHVNP